MGCVLCAEFVFWQANKISPQFQSISRSAYRSIRECYNRVTEVDSFSRCLDTAQSLVVGVGQSAKTRHERMQYADLHSFVNAVDEYHRELLSAVDPQRPLQTQEQLAKFCDRLDKIFE